MDVNSDRKNKVNSFEDLIVWQKADLLFDMVCDDVSNFPNNRVGWVIIDQVLRAIGSVSANIAEGYGSGYQKEFIHSLRIARKEGSESLNWLIKCYKRKFISEKRLQEYRGLLEEVRKMINSLIHKLSSAP